MNKKNLMIILIGVILIASMVVFAVTKDSNIFGDDDKDIEANDNENNTAENDVDEDKNEDKDKVKVPDFTLKNLDGEEVKLSDYKGKIVLINFWATWCPPCDREMPHLEKLYNEYKDELVILAVDVQESKKTVKKYVEKKGLTFPVLLDTDGRVAREYYVAAFPTSYFVDADGYFVERVQGGRTYAEFKQIIDIIRGK